MKGEGDTKTKFGEEMKTENMIDLIVKFFFRRSRCMIRKIMQKKKEIKKREQEKI